MFRSMRTALADLAIKQAKATGKAYTLPDMDGRSMAVTPAGNRVLHLSGRRRAITPSVVAAGRDAEDAALSATAMGDLVCHHESEDASTSRRFLRHTQAVAFAEMSCAPAVHCGSRDVRTRHETAAASSRRARAINRSLLRSSAARTSESSPGAPSN